MKQTLMTALLCTAVCIMANAQDFEKPMVPIATLQNLAMPGGMPSGDGYIANSIIPGFSHKKAITIYGGTAGVGADFRYGILPRLSARLGAGTTPVNVPNAFQVNDFNSQISLNVNFTNVHLIADFQPFGGSGFRLAFGAGYFTKAKTIANITPTGSTSWGNITYTPDELGTLQMTADWKGIAPYVGLGFFRAFPRQLFNINLDLGTYYLSAPQTTIVGTKALVPNDDNNAQLQQNISSYRWLPVLQLNFSFRL